MLAIDFPGKKRIFITNSTTREMISDIFFNKLFKQAFNFFLIFRQIFTNNSIRKKNDGIICKDLPEDKKKDIFESLLKLFVKKDVAYHFPRRTIC